MLERKIFCEGGYHELNLKRKMVMVADEDKISLVLKRSKVQVLRLNIFMEGNLKTMSRRYLKRILSLSLSKGLQKRMTAN